MNKFYIFLLLFIIFFCIFYVYSFSMFDKTSTDISEELDENFYFSNSNFFWPIPGYHKISSYFGKRTSPATGASSFHSGIDIPASEGTNIFAVLSGKVIHAGFYGADGHTIIIESPPFKIIYGHLSQKYLVNVGQIIEQGTIIASVGPKYISGIPNNPYKDSSGKTTNGATTGPHLHLTIKENDSLTNPLSFFNN